MTTKYQTGAHSFTVDRDIRGDLRAETEIPLDGFEAGRVLCITTSKVGRAIQSTASSSIVKHESNGFTSRTMVLFGDFRKTLAIGGNRATEKAIATQHADALEQLEAATAEARAFYVAKAAKETADNS